MSPQTDYELAEAEALLTAASLLNAKEETQSVTVTNEEYDGEFTSRRGTLWDDEE